MEGTVGSVIFLGVLFFCFGDSDGYFRAGRGSGVVGASCDSMSMYIVHVQGTWDLGCPLLPVLPCPDRLLIVLIRSPRNTVACWVVKPLLYASPDPCVCPHRMPVHACV